MFFWSKLSKLHKKDPILHVATTFSLKQGERRTSHGPIPHPLIWKDSYISLPTKMQIYGVKPSFIYEQKQRYQIQFDLRLLWRVGVAMQCWYLFLISSNKISRFGYLLNYLIMFLFIFVWLMDRLLCAETDLGPDRTHQDPTQTKCSCKGLKNRIKHAC